MKKLIRYAGRFKVSLLFVIIVSVCSTIFNVVGPKILSTATTELFNGAVAVMNGTGGINFPKIGTILIWCMGIYLCSALMAFLQGFIMTNVSQKMT